MSRSFEDFEVTFLFSMLGLLVSLMLVRLPSLDITTQEDAIGVLSASIE